MNRSITVSIHQESADFFKTEISKIAKDHTVIINGASFFNPIKNRHQILITIKNCNKEQYRVIRRNNFFKKQKDSIYSFGKTS